MEVTNKNFRDVLPDVSEAVNNSTFLSIDCEFTGIGTSSCHIHGMDTPEERYHKLRKNAVDFLLPQFGLCAFQFEEKSRRYTVKAFNFYVFPRPFSRQAPDIRFMCQSSSIDFLVSQNFDFNKVFREGISYLSPPDEQRLKENLKQKHEHIRAQQASSPAFSSPLPNQGNQVSITKGPIPMSDENKEFQEDISKQIDEFLKSQDEHLELKPCNGFLRKLTYQIVASRYKNAVHLETKNVGSDHKQRYIVVSKVRDEFDFKRREAAKQEAEWQEVVNAVGFTKIIDIISKSGKLIVGHNMLLDLLHIINKFRAPLPDDFEDFKSLTRCIFPRLIDTKLMASTHPFKDHIQNTALGELQKTVQEKPFNLPPIETAHGFAGYSTECEQLHEAGYDAYITGVSFICMANFLGTFQNPSKAFILPGSELLEPFSNKLNLMRVYDIPYINLSAPDLTPSRDHVFYLVFPAEWKTSDIIQLFSPFGNVQVIWLDDTSAFVVLHKKDQAEHVMKNIGLGDAYRIQTYADFKRRRSLSGPSLLKRKIPTSDTVKTLKRKNSLEDVHSASRYSITPIREEDETVHQDASPTELNGNQSAADADASPPKRKRLREEDNTKDVKKSKLFDEPDSW